MYLAIVCVCCPYGLFEINLSVCQEKEMVEKISLLSLVEQKREEVGLLSLPFIVLNSDT